MALVGFLLFYDMRINNYSVNWQLDKSVVRMNSLIQVH